MILYLLLKLIIPVFRLREHIWSMIGEKSGIPWRAAEAMHWHLGEQEIARRAQVTSFNINYSEERRGTRVADQGAKDASTKGEGRVNRAITLPSITTLFPDILKNCQSTGWFAWTEHWKWKMRKTLRASLSWYLLYSHNFIKNYSHLFRYLPRNKLYSRNYNTVEYLSETRVTYRCNWYCTSTLPREYFGTRVSAIGKEYS